jgi:hypothetical protein
MSVLLISCWVLILALLRTSHSGSRTSLHRRVLISRYTARVLTSFVIQTCLILLKYVLKNMPVYYSKRYICKIH